MYGIVANIPTEDHQRQAIVEAIDKTGESTVNLLQQTLRRLEQDAVLGGMDYDVDGNLYTIFFPEELENR